MVRFCEETTGQLHRNSMAEALDGRAKRRRCRNVTEERCVLSSVCLIAANPQGPVTTRSEEASVGVNGE